MKSYWKILQLGIEGSAKTGLNVGAGGQHEPTAKQHHDCLEQTEAEHGKNCRKQGLEGAVFVEAVDQGA